jgi:hypothetical protein
MNALAAQDPPPPLPRVHPYEALRGLANQRKDQPFTTYKEFTDALDALNVTTRLRTRKALGDERERKCFVVASNNKEPELYIVLWRKGDSVAYFPAR